MVFVMPSRHCVVPLANHFLSNIFLMLLISNVFVILGEGSMFSEPVLLGMQFSHELWQARISMYAYNLKI